MFLKGRGRESESEERDRRPRLKVLEGGGKKGNRPSIHAFGRKNVKDIHGRDMEIYRVLPSRYNALKIDQQ